ncbi:MAG: hypothetical protein D6816_15450 [Bacteroidetes bacterium]|nr:MAG: hypothetical protein D6816_15450 [Bacteroidota bacterium]
MQVGKIRKNHLDFNSRAEFFYGQMRFLTDNILSKVSAREVERPNPKNKLPISRTFSLRKREKNLILQSVRNFYLPIQRGDDAPSAGSK